MKSPDTLLIVLALGLATALAPTAHATGPTVSRGLALAPADVVVVTHDGRQGRLPAVLDNDRTVIVDFVFTSCQAICPVMSATFSQVQRRLGGERDRVQLVSVSIDPETDTPAVLKDYAARFHAQPGWTFVTGPRENIGEIQKSFTNFQRNKMEHVAVYVLRPAHQTQWIRLEGGVTAGDLLAEYRRAAGQ